MVQGHRHLKTYAVFDGDSSGRDHARYRCHDRPGVLRQLLHRIGQRGPMQHRYSACLDHELELEHGAEPGLNFALAALANTWPTKMNMTDADTGNPDDNKVVDLDLDAAALDGVGSRWWSQA